jgi:hypothetical protein
MATLMDERTNKGSNVSSCVHVPVMEERKHTSKVYVIKNACG